MNVWGKWHIAQAIQNLLKDAIIDKSYDTPAKIRMSDNLAGQFFAKVDDGTDAHFFPGFDQCLPLIFIHLTQKKDLDLPTRITRSNEACWNDARIIEDQHIALLQKVSKLKKPPMLYRMI